MKTVLALIAAGVVGMIDYGIAAEPKTIKVNLINSSQQEVGTAMLRQTSDGVLIRIELPRNAAGIAPGVHAIHIHEVGRCEPPFKSAGEHFNPLQKRHGFFDKEGRHLGDLPNIHVPKNEPLTVEVLAPQLTLDSGKTGVFDLDGSALVIHRSADDYRTDPAGDSGDRIACAVITASSSAK
jgi:Cu-Zn family superoxide dismutase